MGHSENECPGSFCGSYINEDEERVPMCGACMSELIGAYNSPLQYVMKDWILYGIDENARCVRCNIKGGCIFEVPKCDNCADEWTKDRKNILEKHRQTFCFPQIPDSSESDESHDFDYPDDA